MTLRMMVQHRWHSNLTDTPSSGKTRRKTVRRRPDVLDLPADFEPGKKHRYSNTNYLLISELIEKTTGYSTFEYIREEILTPLGLENTFGSIHDADMDRVMSGYYVGNENDLKDVDYGSMLATAEDVGIFLRALNDGSLFEEGEKEIYSSIYVFDHTGWVPGYQSIAGYHRDIDAIVVQFNNSNGGYNWNIAEIVDIHKNTETKTRLLIF
ncbi:MAG: serine hydrolase domain-containing protein [Bacteroidales bacterium]